MAPRHFMIALLVVLAAGLVPLAQASPPDQTWLGGLYDDADYDDVVLSITSAVGAVESYGARDIGSRQPIVESPILLDEIAPACPTFSSKFSRAPPTS